MSETQINIFDSLNFVSRGGQKLAKALDFFEVSPQGRVCLDCGASTGGFTDCLLQRGAGLVYAIDVGYGQLAWTLRNNPRVKVMERTNIRYVKPEQLAEKPTLAVIDVSFISLSLVLPVINNLMKAGYGTPEEICKINKEAVCLIKPQFEAGKGKVGRKGVVREPEIHGEVLNSFMEYAAKSGFTVMSLTHSPVKGPKGNIEFLGYLVLADDSVKQSKTGIDAMTIKKIVTCAHMELK